MLKTFTYAEDGLAYTVTLFEDPETPGRFLADITVDEGAMDVNAVYFGDDDPSGDSEMLSGPLNMNGASSSDGEQVQWDEAIELSRPGLGREGEDKDTYLTTGDTLTLELDIDSLDEIDVWGIRATSTTTEEGSVKAVSDMPEEPEEPEEPTYDKLGFGVETDENGGITKGVFVGRDDLPEDQEATFENYVNFYESEFGSDPEFALTELETVIVFDVNEQTDGDGNVLEIPEELFRLDAPEGGFEDAGELIAAHDAVIEGASSDDMSIDGASSDDASSDGVSSDGTEGGTDDGANPEDGAELMAALSLLDVPETDAPEQDADADADEDDLELV